MLCTTTTQTQPLFMNPSLVNYAKVLVDAVMYAIYANLIVCYNGYSCIMLFYAMFCLCYVIVYKIPMLCYVIYHLKCYIMHMSVTRHESS